MSRRTAALLAAYSAFTAGFGNVAGNARVISTKAEKLIEETKQIKGLSAKEMGTSGKGKKISRAKRKKNNMKNRK